MVCWSEINTIYNYSKIINCTNNPPECLEGFSVFNNDIQYCRNSDCQYIYCTIKDIKEYWQIYYYWFVLRLSSLSIQSKFDQYIQRIFCQRLILLCRPAGLSRASLDLPLKYREYLLEYLYWRWFNNFIFTIS